MLSPSPPSGLFFKLLTMKKITFSSISLRRNFVTWNSQKVLSIPFLSIEKIIPAPKKKKVLKIK
jgi:hypothetical protein